MPKLEAPVQYARLPAVGIEVVENWLEDDGSAESDRTAAGKSATSIDSDGRVGQAAIVKGAGYAWSESQSAGSGYNIDAEGLAVN